MSNIAKTKEELLTELKKFYESIDQRIEEIELLNKETISKRFEMLQSLINELEELDKQIKAS